MSEIRMFRTATGEDIIAEYVGQEFYEDKQIDAYVNAIQLVILPPKAGKAHSSYGFAAFPQYAKPESKMKLYFPRDRIIFFIDIEQDFLEQYLSIFGGIVPQEEKKLILN